MAGPQFDLIENTVLSDMLNVESPGVHPPIRSNTFLTRVYRGVVRNYLYSWLLWGRREDR